MLNLFNRNTAEARKEVKLMAWPTNGILKGIRGQLPPSGHQAWRSDKITPLWPTLGCASYCQSVPELEKSCASSTTLRNPSEAFQRLKIFTSNFGQEPDMTIFCLQKYSEDLLRDGDATCSSLRVPLGVTADTRGSPSRWGLYPWRCALKCQPPPRMPGQHTLPPNEKADWPRVVVTLGGGRATPSPLKALRSWTRTPEWGHYLPGAFQKRQHASQTWSPILPNSHERLTWRILYSWRLTFSNGQRWVGEIETYQFRWKMIKKVAWLSTI